MYYDTHMGRHSSYTPELADEICDRMANGESLRSICVGEMPDRCTVARWQEARPEFAAKCARANEMGADASADHIQHLADETVAGTIDPRAAQVAIGTYQWLIERKNQRKWGNKSSVELSGSVDLGSAAELLQQKRKERLAKG